MPLQKIPQSQLEDSAVGTTQLADSAVTTAKLAANSVTAEKIPDGALTQAKMGAGIAGNGPAFSVFRNTSTQTVTSGVATKVQLNGEDFDTDNDFDSTTNFRFQPAVAGYYMLTGRILSSASGGGSVATAMLYKNGALVLNGQAYIPPSGSSSQNTTVAGLVYLNGSTDYVELWGNLNGTGTITITNGTGITYFQGALVRAG